MPRYKVGLTSACQTNCCATFARFVLNIVPAQGQNPQTSPVVAGSLKLYRYASGSGGILDRNLTLDVSSLTSMTPHEASLTTFTVPILEDGVEVGRLTYHWISGDGVPDGTGGDLANVTVVYNNAVYLATDCYYESIFAQGFLCLGNFDSE